MSEATYDLEGDELKLNASDGLDQIQKRAFGIGGIATLAVLGYGFTAGDAQAFYRAWLIGWLWILGIAMGLFALSMLNHQSGGRWGLYMRRIHEAGGRTLIWVLLLGLPLFSGLDKLYWWAKPNPDYHHNPLKEFLLNPTAYMVVTVGVVLFWWVLAFLNSRASHVHDQTGDDKTKYWMQARSAFGLVTYVLTGTVVSVVWVMSIDKVWFSSLYGVAFVAGHGLSAFSFMIPVMLFLSTRKPFVDKVTPRLFHDYGKLMLAFTALWAYFTVSQFLIIWSGNLPEEVGWYLERGKPGWLYVSIALMVGHFVVPFLILLSQDLKKDGKKLARVACWLLVMRLFDLYWNVAPTHFATYGIDPSFSWMEIVAPIGLFGIWLGLLIREIKGRVMLPVGEPYFKEASAHG